MSKRMLNGFTLVELLGILAILAIVVLITSPVILGVIKDTNKNAFLDTAYTINKAATNYYTSAATSNNTVPLLITYDKNNITSKRPGEGASSNNYLKYTGKHPYSGNVYIGTNGEILMAIYDNRSNVCVEKSASDKVPVVVTKTKNECFLDITVS